MRIHIPKGWEIPEHEAAPEAAWWSRRRWLVETGSLAGFGAVARAQPAGVYPVRRNPEFGLDRPVTEEWAATGYNNFYEFDGLSKEAVKQKVGAYNPRPWTVEVGGLVNKPRTFDIEWLEKNMPLEERLYRFRCVEAWAMAVPWTGFPMSALLKLVEPRAEARFVRFISVNRPKEMPGIRAQNWYPWPYFEALRLDEAMNPLALFVTGLYGKPLPKQNGAPFRVVTPWKYGFKSAKAVVKIELVAQQPPTFWSQLQPLEYTFYANVNPKRPHPRWSQAVERMIPTGDRRPTLAYNGYEKWVAGMYNGSEV